MFAPALLPLLLCDEAALCVEYSAYSCVLLAQRLQYVAATEPVQLQFFPLHWKFGPMAVVMFWKALLVCCTASCALPAA